MAIKNTNLYKELVKRKSGYIDNINKVYVRAEEFLPKINRMFVHYTGHRIEHFLNVMKYMRIDVDIAGMYLHEYYLNINGKKIIPNIARDDLRVEDEKQIKTQMEFAVYRHIIEKIMDSEVADAIERYIKKKEEIEVNCFL